MYREHLKKKKTKTDIKERVLAGADNTISERKKEIRDNKLYSNTISQESITLEETQSSSHKLKERITYY